MKVIKTISKTKQKYLNHQHHTGIYCKCPDCNGDVIYGAVSCSDEREGCCVAHYNYGCRNCKSVFDIIFEDESKIIPEKFIISQEIGICIFNIG